MYIFFPPDFFRGFYAPVSTSSIEAFRKNYSLTFCQHFPRGSEEEFT